MSQGDGLLLFRNAIAAQALPVLTTSQDVNTAESNKVDSLAIATHLYFSNPLPQCLPLSASTRFVSTTPDTTAVDLRSIYFAWVKKDVPVNEYIALAQELDGQLPEGQRIRNLVFVERLDLITWLEGASDESEYIKPLEGSGGGNTDVAARVADVAAGAGVPTVSGAGVGVVQQTGVGGRPVKVIDARLQEIYNGERLMGDRNSVLRGIKPTDFSHVRKTAEAFLGRHRKPPPSQQNRPGQPLKPGPTTLANRPQSGPQKAASSQSKRQDPIILLSPSASSLLRLSNIKSFLDSGLFVPADHPQLSSQTSTNLLHITRPLRSLDPSGRPYRFIIVDSPEQFKPDYWNRVVAVFTTGQVWQFRSYKWREPQELFGHILGVYVGERGQNPPNEVRSWGSGVKSFFLERWDEKAHGTNVDVQTREGRRWRDRETVESLWGAIEGHMRSKGEWRR
ncbi:hypothetical protein GJ744_003661 [Endocarpon pusillum]|uniref:Cell division control protein 73 C-terminal domain-containing protein n=1 Tax=Endocarpon pusillum TaxID=364733 RepID=A0A8H7AE17_9EURO|nr:hypothetical protein GJ744_003661 [Endocarpon pusillum]